MGERVNHTTFPNLTDYSYSCTINNTIIEFDPTLRLVIIILVGWLMLETAIYEHRLSDGVQQKMHALQRIYKRHTQKHPVL